MQHEVTLADAGALRDVRGQRCARRARRRSLLRRATARRSPTRAPVDPRPDGDASPCSRCGGLGEEITTPCTDCRGDGRRTEERVTPSTFPPGVDNGTTLRARRPRRSRAARRAHRRPVRAHQGAAARPLHARRLRPRAHAAHPGDPGRPRRLLPFATLDGDEDLVIPAGTQTGREFKLRGRGVPHLEGRGRGDLIVRVVVDTPTRLGRDEEELVAQAGRPSAARTWLRPTAACSRRSARRSSSRRVLPAAAAHVFVDDLGAPEVEHARRAPSLPRAYGCAPVKS